MFFGLILLDLAEEVLRTTPMSLWSQLHQQHMQLKRSDCWHPFPLLALLNYHSPLLKKQASKYIRGLYVFANPALQTSKQIYIFSNTWLPLVSTPCITTLLSHLERPFKHYIFSNTWFIIKKSKLFQLKKIWHSATVVVPCYKSEGHMYKSDGGPKQP